jgi:hypothetical protein
MIFGILTCYRRRFAWIGLNPTPSPNSIGIAIRSQHTRACTLDTSGHPSPRLRCAILKLGVPAFQIKPLVAGHRGMRPGIKFRDLRRGRHLRHSGTLVAPTYPISLTIACLSSVNSHYLTLQMSRLATPLLRRIPIFRIQLLPRQPHRPFHLSSCNMSDVKKVFTEDACPRKLSPIIPPAIAWIAKANYTSRWTICRPPLPSSPDNAYLQHA